MNGVRHTVRGIKGSEFLAQFKAFPDWVISIAFDASSGYGITLFLLNNGHETVLKFISVFAEEILIKPIIKYSDIVGVKAGTETTERITK